MEPFIVVTLIIVLAILSTILMIVRYLVYGSEVAHGSELMKKYMARQRFNNLSAAKVREIEDPEMVVESIMVYIDLKILRKEWEDIDHMPECFKYIYSIYWLESEVYNKGFEGYFTGKLAKYYKLALKGFRQIGNDDAYTMLAAAGALAVDQGIMLNNVQISSKEYAEYKKIAKKNKYSSLKEVEKQWMPQKHYRYLQQAGYIKEVVADEIS